MKIDEVENAWYAAALEFYENHPDHKRKAEEARERARRSRARYGPGRWRAKYPDTRREWREAAQQALEEWGRRGGWELRRDRSRRHVIQVHPARRCQGGCGRWLIDLGIKKIDAPTCHDRECKKVYEATRSWDPEWWGPTVFPPAKRDKRPSRRPVHGFGDAGVIPWLDAYCMRGSFPMPRDLAAQRDDIEVARGLRPDLFDQGEPALVEPDHDQLAESTDQLAELF